jgi:hypothetical protein
MLKTHKAPPVYRPTPQRIAAAPLVYRPSQTGSLTAQLKPANIVPASRPAPPVYKPQQQATADARSPINPAPLGFRSNPPITSNRMIPQKINRSVQPRTEKGNSASRVHKGIYVGPHRPQSIQLHPLTIKVDGYNPWERDSKDIDLASDIELFKSKINSNNPRVTSIEVRKKSKEDHQVVVVGTKDGGFVQMDLGINGSMIRYGNSVQRNHYEVLVAAFVPREDLCLHDVFKAFYEQTGAKAFNFENYNCTRFASDLAGRMGTSDGSDDDFM